MHSSSKQSTFQKISTLILHTCILGPLAGGVLTIEQLVCETWFAPIFKSILNHMLGWMAIPAIGAGLTATSLVIWTSITVLALRLIVEAGLRFSGLSETFKDNFNLYTSMAYVAGVHLIYYGLQDLGYGLPTAMITAGVMTSVYYFVSKAVEIFNQRSFGYVPKDFNPDDVDFDVDSKPSPGPENDLRHSSESFELSSHRQSPVMSRDELEDPMRRSPSPALTPLMNMRREQASDAGSVFYDNPPLELEGTLGSKDLSKR